MFLFVEFHVLGLNGRCRVAGAGLRQASQADGAQVPRLSLEMTIIAEYQAHPLTSSNKTLSPSKVIQLAFEYERVKKEYTWSATLRSTPKIPERGEAEEGVFL